MGMQLSLGMEGICNVKFSPEILLRYDIWGGFFLKRMGMASLTGSEHLPPSAPALELAILCPAEVNA